MGHAAHPAPATRPALEVAHILRDGAEAYREAHRLSSQQQRVVNALVSCRTAALGGFKSHCDHCGTVTIQYASCRNRHCPKCQTLAQTRWVERQCADLLDIAYWHVVFTLPHELNPVAQGNPALIYRLLFNAASKTLLEFGRNPRWLGGELGITMVLHTWGQNLGQHIHVHCLVTDGALSPDRERWLSPPRRGFLFPTTALSKVFRGKYLDSLCAAHRSGELRMPGDDDIDDTRAFESLKTSLQSNDWVVYTKAPLLSTESRSTIRLVRAWPWGRAMAGCSLGNPTGGEVIQAIFPVSGLVVWCDRSRASRLGVYRVRVMMGDSLARMDIPVNTMRYSAPSRAWR